MKKIYFDNASTSPLSECVYRAINDYYSQNTDILLADEKKALEKKAEDTLLRCIQAPNGKVIWTSSGTEANNMAILTHLRRYPQRKKILVSAIEHPSVLNAVRSYESKGYNVILCPVDRDGRVDLDQVAKQLDQEVALLAVMLVNNEIGTIQPVERLAEMAEKWNIPFHVDAIQALGKCSISLDKSPGIHSMSFSAHKIHGPKGIGALYLKNSVEEKRVISSPYNHTALIHAFGLAVSHMNQKQALYQWKMDLLKSKLLSGLKSIDQSIHLSVKNNESVSSIVNVCFPMMDSDLMLIQYDLNGVSLSAGSACSSGAISASHVIRALGYTEEKAKKCIRFSFGIHNTTEEVEKVIEVTRKILKGTANG